MLRPSIRWARSALLLCSLGVLHAACGGEAPPPDPTGPPDPTEPTPPPTRPPGPGDVTTPLVAFVDVTLVPMDREVLEPGMTVLTENGRIVEVGPTASVTVPSTALVIDGRGQFLIPGLADMHTHISVVNSTSVAPAPESAEDQGILFVANGVTTILNMGDFGGHDVIALRNRFAAGEALGPFIIAGHFARGATDGGQATYRATTVAQARTIVDRAARLGYDFVKVYSAVTSEAFREIVSRSGAAGMPVFGHIPTTFGIVNALSGGQVMVAHASEFLTLHYNRQLNSSLTPAAITKAKTSDAWTTTTLVASEGFRAAWGNNVNGLLQYIARPMSGDRFTHPEIQQRWRFWLGLGGTPGQLDAELPFLLEYTRDFYRGGVNLMLGTDAADVAGVASGFSVHRELELLVQGGLTPYEALTTATSNPGRFVEQYFPDQDALGRVVVGARADLLLLRSDPLQAVSALQDRVGVMVRGRWHTEQELSDRLEALAAGYGR